MMLRQAKKLNEDVSEQDIKEKPFTFKFKQNKF